MASYPKNFLKYVLLEAKRPLAYLEHDTYLAQNAICMIHFYAKNN